MVNYGYECIGWTAEQKLNLSIQLGRLVSQYKDKHGQTPEIEIDGLYNGVRIRRMTWLDADQIEDLISKADALFRVIQ